MVCPTGLVSHVPWQDGPQNEARTCHALNCLPAARSPTPLAPTGEKSPQQVNLAKCWSSDVAQGNEVCNQHLLLTRDAARQRERAGRLLGGCFKRCTAAQDWKNLGRELMELQPAHSSATGSTLRHLADGQQSMSPAFPLKGYAQLVLRMLLPGQTHPICLGYVKWAHLQKQPYFSSSTERKRGCGRENKPFSFHFWGSGKKGFVRMGEPVVRSAFHPRLPHQSPLRGPK